MKVIIMSGVSGSGKSTYIKKHYPEAAVCSADHFFMVDGLYCFDQHKLPEAHGACLRKFIRLVCDDSDMRLSDTTVVVDNTNTTVAEIAPYAAIALAYKCDMEIVTIRSALDIAEKRNTHGVSGAAILAQARRLNARQMPPWWKSTDLFVQVDGSAVAYSDEDEDE